MALLLALLLSQVPGSIELDPALSWYTLETRHFDVHFACRGRPDAGHDALAREVAAICEEVHTTLVPAAGWTPRGRTQVVVADFYDYWNGWTTPFPDNTVTIIPTPPGDASNRTNDDNWLRTLILHEYTHVLQTDMVAGVPAALRAVFGRVALPNAVAPAWVNEGYAVFCETRFTDFGRIRSAEFDMTLRAAADSNRLLPLDRAGNYELRRWPGGNAPYLYGSMLHEDVAREFGPDRWRAFNVARSAGLPFFENLHSRQVFGRGLEGLYARWQAAERLHADSVRRAVGAGTPFRRLTHEAWYTSAPTWSRTGAEVYFQSHTDQEYPAIKAVDTATGAVRVLHRGPVTGSMSLSPDGRSLAFCEQNLVAGVYQYDDLFTLDLATGAVRQLTHRLRARDPGFAPDGSLLVFVTNDCGQDNLRLLDLATGRVTTLTETEDRTAFHSPCFSPTGYWIAVGVNRPGGYADIELVDRRTGWTVPVTHDRATDLSPAWSRTGKYLFFASDRSGVFNLYAYQLATGMTFRCSDVLYGAFEPAVSPDNRRIAFLSHSASGDDVALTDLWAADWQPAPDYVDDRPDLAPADTPVSSRLYYYDPFPSLWPRFWLPWVDHNDGWDLGAFTLGWDALQMHRYRVTAGYRTGRAAPFLSASYELRRYRPRLSFAADVDSRVQSGSVNAELPFERTDRAHWLDLTLEAAHDTLLSSQLALDWSYSEAHIYRFSVAPVEGGVAALHVDARSRAVLSDRDEVRVLGYYARYIGNPPANWSLRVSAALGTAAGDSSADRAWRLEPGTGLLAVRGFADTSRAGRTIAVLGLQFRAPLWWVEHGISTAPVFLSDLNWAVFADWGMVAPDPLSASRLGIGVELRADMLLGHLLPVSLAGGAALGLTPGAKRRWYLEVESSTLAGILARPRGEPAFLRHLPEKH